MIQRGYAVYIVDRNESGRPEAWRWICDAVTRFEAEMIAAEKNRLEGQTFYEACDLIPGFNVLTPDFRKEEEKRERQLEQARFARETAQAMGTTPEAIERIFG